MTTAQRSRQLRINEPDRMFKPKNRRIIGADLASKIETIGRCGFVETVPSPVDPVTLANTPIYGSGAIAGV